MVTRAEIILAATDRAQAAFGSVSRGLDMLKDKGLAAKAGLATIGGAVAGGIALIQAKGSIDMLDQLDDLQEKTGISVEKLSELRFAGESVGTPFEALAGGVGRLSKLMAEAAGGNKEAAQTFKSLGIEVKNADGTLRTNDQVLGDLADRFASYSDGAGKSALAQRFFGKSGAEMIPLLNQGREGIEKLRLEAESLGAIYSGSLAKDAADFNDNLTKLKLSSEAASIALGGPFIKSLVDISAQMLQARKEGGLLHALMVTIGGGVARTLGVDEIGKTQDRARAATTEMQRLQGLMAGVELQLQRDPADEMANRRIETYRAKIADQQKIAASASEELKRLANLADPSKDPQRRQEDRGFIPVIADNRKEAPVLPSGGGSAKEKDEEAAAKRYLDTLQKQLEKAKELSQVEIALEEIKRIRAKGGVVTEGEKQSMLRAAAQIDVIKEREEIQKKAEKERDESQRRFLALQDEAKRVTEEVRTPTEALGEAMARLNMLRDQGVLSTEMYSRAVAKEGLNYVEAQKRIEELANKSDEFSKRAAENIQDYLGTSLTESLDGNFSDILGNFSKMLKRMVAEAIAANIARSMFGDLVQGGSGSGWFGTALKGVGSLLGLGGTSLATANAVTAANAVGVAGGDGLGTLMALTGARAGGGGVHPDGSYLVGELGPEIFTPDTAGSIIPNNQLGAAAAPASITYAPVFQIDGAVDRARSLADMQRVSAESERRLMAQLVRRKVIPA